ncbi:hypothetical protein O1611_g2505 [Lasiodiplodia mahajangana]|uniref:Uncharacterized protein n=1 Tax=Lasiodiplodia mahajangana TaxID=1108764 RepID=A0ACC2JUA8_9PEZI|nr:hypothetical protein O1611_g2505 [Lasiodiplodia mahajangana]
MDDNGAHAKDKRSDSDAKSKDNTPTAANTPTDTNKSPRKRRKPVYTAADLDPDAKKPKGSNHAAARDESDTQPELSRNSIDQGTNAMVPPSFDSTNSQGSKPGFGPLSQGNRLQLVPPSPVSGLQQAVTSATNMNQLTGFSDAWLTAQNQFHDMHHYNPQYMLPQEVTHEFNLLNDFLNTSLLDESGTLTDEQNSIYRNQLQAGQADMAGFLGNPLPPSAMEVGSMLPPNAERNLIRKANGTAPQDKTREFYLQAADPSGNDTPEARMQRVLKAKYDAGLLKPFNYIKGYARLSNYMDGHIAPASKQKILRQLDRFRPKFREKVQGLTDMELVYVEMWFEKSLMEYDRVFASMAVPACCWRRSGEIFRGNKEMAELIHVPVERLRDGKISLHEVMTEDSLVRYWEEFGTIAFDPAHDTLLTACALKNPDDRSNDPTVNCCFSFMIRRDEHKMGDTMFRPSLIFAIMERSNTPSTTKKSQPVDDAIQLSSKISAQSFDTSTDSSIRDLANEIESQIQILKTYNSRSLTTEHYDRLNTAGLGLWNWCTQEKRRGSDNALPARNKLFCLIRVLSFFMLIRAHRNDDDSPKTTIHLIRLATKTSRSCIASDKLEFGLWALQKAVEYNGLLQRLQGSPPPEQSHTCQQFEVECLTLRIVLASAWKDDRMDVAENVYASLEKLITDVDIASIEKLVDAIFEIGRDLSLKKNSVLAAKWLERAYHLINGQAIDQLSRDAIELRLAISQVLIQAYLDIGSLDYVDRAKNHVAYIENELGDKLIVLLLRTEILIRSPAEIFDSEAYADILRRMIRTVDVSESSFKLLLHHIRKLDEKDNLAASSVLNHFLISRLITSQREEWIDKAIILCTDMAIRDGSTESIKALETVLDHVLPNIGKPLSVNTAAGIQTLISKKADTEFSQAKFELARNWCQLALHPSLEQSGPSNMGKMARKLLLCVIQQNDLLAATNILQTMNDVTLKEPMTAYLAFRVALKHEDTDSAVKCLKQISEASTSDPKYMYACCLEAQQAHDRVAAIKALQHLVFKPQFHPSDSIHLPALLRVLIRLEVSVLNDEQEIGADRGSLVEDICNTFEAAVDEIHKEHQDTRSDKLFTIDELDWFSKNAYNLGLVNAMVWEARCVVTILESCLSIISSYPPDIPAQIVADISLRGMFCNFMAATVLLALARSEDNTELRLQDYLNMRRHVKSFYVTLESRLNALDDSSREDLQTKLSTLLVFEAQPGRSLSAYQAMADFLYQTMRELVNQIWALENFGQEKLAKYMRCLLKITLPMEYRLSLNLIEEITTIIKQSAHNENHFPPIELEWITITAFNHGVELYGIHEDELSKAWTSHALSIAHYLRDGGELERQLQDRYTKLKWDET